jgi:acyl-homoserine-lactone acylase
VGLVLAAAGLVVACTDDDDEAASSTAASVGSTTVAATGSSAPTTVATGASTVASTPSSVTTTAAPADDGGYEATIRRTTDGVPHITGESIADVIFGEGYANGQDHACTLADQLLKVQGRRAAAFGAGEDGANVDSDFAWRAIGIDALARADWETAAPAVRETFEAYAAGWNLQLADNGVDGLSGWCAGADWVQPISAEDLYAYSRSLTLLASSARLTGFIASAAPPGEATPTTEPAGFAHPDSTGSNAWAVGRDLVTGGQGGLLVANPHFPWEGELRFWEVHLTVPGELDIYGGTLIGQPGIGIGFTEEFAWSHTVSAGNRFTAYSLTLDPADPTRYLVDGASREMTATEYEVEVLRGNGSTRTVRRTMWSSEYGPILDFPGFGWTESATLTYRDANLENDEFAEQYVAMTTAQSFDEFITAHREHQGVPLFNTVAVSADGRAWYADTSATPNLSDAAERIYLRRLENDPITQIARDNGVVLLDGSDSRFVWAESGAARDPGLVPFDEMPMVERSDYVFNANDSFWMPHATEMLEGDYSRLHGPQQTQRSLRTRENANVLSGVGRPKAAGADGTFTGEELRDAAFLNLASSARLLRGPVVERCEAATVVDVPELVAEDGTVALPAESVDVTAACDVLAAWDGRYDLDREGAVLWRELLAAVRRDVPDGIDGLWAVPFDPARARDTPRGLAPAGPDGDPVLAALARAVQTVTKAGSAVDVPLGDVQYALRTDPRVAVHGGPGPDGLPNVVDYSDPSSTSEPMPEVSEPVVPGSDLRTEGYPVDRGTSFVMTVDYTGDDPRAWVILTYGETGDRESDLFDVQTARFRDKDWREAAFTEEAIAADPDLTELTVTGD